MLLLLLLLLRLGFVGATPVCLMVRLDLTLLFCFRFRRRVFRTAVNVLEDQGSMTLKNGFTCEKGHLHTHRLLLLHIHGTLSDSPHGPVI